MSAKPPPGVPGHIHEIDRDCCGHVRPPRTSLGEDILSLDQSQRIAAYFLLWWAWFGGLLLMMWPASWVLQALSWLFGWKL